MKRKFGTQSTKFLYAVSCRIDDNSSIVRIPASLHVGAPCFRENLSKPLTPPLSWIVEDSVDRRRIENAYAKTSVDDIELSIVCFNFLRD